MPVKSLSGSELFPSASVDEEQPKRTASFKSLSGSQLFSQAEEEDDLVQDEQSTFARLTSGAAKSIKNSGARAVLSIGEAEFGAYQAVGNALGLLSPESNATYSRIRKEMARQKREVYPLSESARRAEAAGEWYKSPAWLAENAMDVGADLVIAAGSSFLTGNPFTGLAYMGGKAGGSTMGDAYDRLKAKGYDDATAAKMAVGEGGVVAVTAAVTSKLPLGFLKGKPALQKTLFGMAAKKAAQAGAVAGGEAIEEVAEGTANDFTQWLFENDPDAFKDFWSKRSKEAVLGALAGGVIGGAKVSADMVDDKRITKFLNQTEKIMQQEGGADKLAALANTPEPTRTDFKKAGIRGNFNTDQRAVLAESLKVIEPVPTPVAKVEPEPVAMPGTPEAKAKEENIELLRETEKKVDAKEEVEKLLQVAEPTVKPVDIEAEVAYKEALDRDEAAIQRVKAEMDAAEAKRKAKKAERAAQRPAGRKKKPLLPPIVTEEAGTLDIDATATALANIASGKRVDLVTMIGERPARLARWAGRKIKGLVLSRGPYKPGSFRAIERRNFRVKTEYKKAEFAVRDFRKTVNKEYGVGTFGELDADTNAQIRSVLKGEEKIDVLPKGMHESVRAIRKHVDTLSRELVNSGAIEGALEMYIPDDSGMGRTDIYQGIREALESGEPNAFQGAVKELVGYGLPEKRAATLVKIIANDGMYLTTAYEAFRDPNWSERVPDEVVNDFVNWRLGENPELTEVEVRNEVGKILLDAKEAGHPMTFIARGGVPAKDLSNLKHKKNLPDVWRALLGERLNPIDNYIDSIYGLSRLLATQQMYEDIKADGLENGYLFDPKDPQAIPLGAFAEIAAKTNEGRTPLSGMKTFPEVAEAFKEIDSSRFDNILWNGLMFLSSVSDAGKTAGSPMAMVRQIPSNSLNMLSNGHNPATIVKMVPKVLTNLFGSKNQVNRDYVLAAVSRGVLGENVDMGVLEDRHSQGLMAEAFDEIMSGKSSARKILSIVAKMPGQLYASFDDIFKLATWEAEIQNYKKAYPEWTDEQIMDVTAEIVRDTNATYSKIPPALRALKRSPFGNFISFQSEQVRNLYHRNRIMIKELNDPRTRFIGARRLAGQLASRAIPVALASFYRWYSTTSKEDDEDLRRHIPPWSKLSTIVHLGRDNEGVMKYADLAYSDPLSFLTDSARALANGDIAGAAKAIVEPYVEAKLATKLLNELANGVDENGNPLWNEHDDPEQKLWAAIQYAFTDSGALQPGIASSLERIKKGIYPMSAEEGKRYKVGTEATALITGTRLSNADIRQSLTHKSRNFQRDVSEINNIYNKVANRKGVVFQGELVSAYARMERTRRDTFNAMVEDVQSGIRLLKGYDFDYKDAEKLLLENGVPEEMVKNVLSGEYKPYVPTDLKALDRMMTIAEPEHREVLAAARLDKIGSLVKAAAGPGQTDKSVKIINNARATLAESGVGLEEGITALRAKLLREDQERANEAAEKAGRVPRMLTAPEGSTSRRQSLRRLGVDKETSRAFFGRL